MKKIFLFGAGALLLLLSLFPFLKSNQEKPKVYDCFLFFNELELLEIRLHEMYPHVDHFVIVEAVETFRGKEKPLHFAENAHRFEAFKDKIIHIVVQERLQTDNPWERERFQREQVMRGLKGCHGKDIIFLSDLDEIVKGSCIPDLVQKISSGKVDALVCEQKMYYGFLNRYQSLWPGTMCTSYKKLKGMTIRLIRSARNEKPRKLRRAHINRFERVKDAGWHFTSMGGIDRWILKLEFCSHTKRIASESWRDGEEFRSIISSTSPVLIDASFPRYVVDNQDYLQQIGFIYCDIILETAVESTN